MAFNSHFIGTDVSKAQNVEEALYLAKLNFDVKKMPAGYMGVDGLWHAVKDRFHVVRTDTQESLGEVSDNYALLPNRKLLEVCDVLALQGARFERIGVMKGGGQVFASMALPFEVRVGGRDLVNPYVTIVNGHDGKRALRAFLTSVRVACTNQVLMAAANSLEKFYARHRASELIKIDTFPNIVLEARERFQEYENAANRLMEVKFSEKQLTEFVNQLFPSDKQGEDVPKQTLTKRERVKVLAFTGDGHSDNGIIGTAWAALQAATQFADREVTVKQTEGRTLEEARAESVLFGTGAKIKARASEIIFEMTKEYANAKAIVPISVT